MEQPRVLVVSAHPADFCIRAGGTIARYTQAGARVKVLVLSYGERGESNELWLRGSGQVTLEEVRAVRHEEVVAAARVLGAEIECFGWPDQPLLFDAERYRRLVRSLREFRPSLVLTHAPREPYNPDHEETCQATIKAVYFARLAGVEPDLPVLDGVQIFMYEPSAPLTEAAGFNPHVYVDITDVMEIKQKAMACFTSQPYHLERYTELGRSRGTQAAYITTDAGIVYAEAFERFKPQVARWLH